jgi:hypothetical protein
LFNFKSQTKKTLSSRSHHIQISQNPEKTLPIFNKTSSARFQPAALVSNLQLHFNFPSLEMGHPNHELLLPATFNLKFANNDPQQISSVSCCQVFCSVQLSLDITTLALNFLIITINKLLLMLV